MVSSHVATTRYGASGSGHKAGVHVETGSKQVFPPAMSALSTIPSLLARCTLAGVILLVIAGPVGSFLHLRGNYLSEREFDPSVLGFDLWVAVFRGEAPALAPGTLVQP